MAVAGKTLDLEKIRQDFPVLQQKVRGKPLVYLDNAATSQKPRVVIERVHHYYSRENSNINRGVHYLSERATEEYELARKKIQKFINAAQPSEIVFVRGTTEAINLVASSFGRQKFQRGDEILISAMEHHANIVPWQLLAEQMGGSVRVVPITDRGELRMDLYQEMLNDRTRLVAMAYVSNVLGTINPVKEIIGLAHERDIPVLLDAAQAVPHMCVDVQDLDCDFMAFSGHKTFAPTGIGALYGKYRFLEQMPPYQTGGDMISTVTFEKTTFKSPPYRFEAGTPHVSGVIGFGTAVDYLNSLGMPLLHEYEQSLLRYATDRIMEVPGLRLIGEAKEKASVISFLFDDVHAHDVGTILDLEGIAIRVGHHCAMPLMQRYGVPATARASLAFYNSTEDIDRLAEALLKVKEVFG